MHFGQDFGTVHCYRQPTWRALQIHSEENLYILNWAWRICTYWYHAIKVGM